LLCHFLDRPHHKQRVSADHADARLPVLGGAQPRDIAGHDKVIAAARVELDELHGRRFPSSYAQGVVSLLMG
jgi:hypothetical protein